MSDDGARFDIEFLDERAESDDEDLSGASSACHRVTMFLLVCVAVSIVMAGIVVQVARSGHDHSPMPSREPERTGRILPAPSSSALARNPRSAVLRATAVLCPAATCRVEPATTAFVHAAQLAFGPLLTLQARTIRPRVATVVAALSADGAQLLAIATHDDVVVDPDSLDLPPPFAVQSQHNGPDRLVVVVSGTVGAVGLLARPAVQRWLATLRPPR